MKVQMGWNLFWGAWNLYCAFFLPLDRLSVANGAIGGGCLVSVAYAAQSLRKARA